MSQFYLEPFIALPGIHLEEAFQKGKNASRAEMFINSLIQTAESKNDEQFGSD